MDKIIRLDDVFFTGEPTIQTVVTPLKNGKFSFEKTALSRSQSPALDYINAVTPEPGCTIVLVNALGAFETYGCNRNGDAFPAQPYNVGKTIPKGNPKDLDGWVNRKETLLEHYTTFESAGIFEHHINKDIGKSLGNVLKAFWNPRMQRVELLLKIVNSRKVELIQKINDGEYPAVSMGCRVRWDVCSDCGNRAPTRKEYCEHLLYNMREVSPRGLVWCALNPSPHFFDISFVLRPADQTGYMLKKVAETQSYELWTKSAELGEIVNVFNKKQAEVKKVGDIQKQVTEGAISNVKSDPEGLMVRKYCDSVLRENVTNLRPSTSEEIDQMAEFPIQTVLGTLAKHGAFLGIGEFTELWCKKAGYVPTHREKQLVALTQPLALSILSKYPDLADKLAEIVSINADKVDINFEQKLGSWLKKRASVGEYLQQRLHEPNHTFNASNAGPGYLYNARAPAKSDLLTLTDPNTGQTYRTTRGAAQAASQANDKSLLGGTSLLGAAYLLALSKNQTLKKLPLPLRMGLGAAAGYGTTKALITGINPPYHHLQYTTDQGPNVAGNTEFVKASTLLLDKMAFDYFENLGFWPKHSSLKQALEEQVATTLDNEKIAQWVSNCEQPSYNSVEPARISVAKVASIFHRVIKTS
jgi:hypothetical protein